MGIVIPAARFRVPGSWHGHCRPLCCLLPAWGSAGARSPARGERFWRQHRLVSAGPPWDGGLGGEGHGWRSDLGEQRQQNSGAGQRARQLNGLALPAWK